MDGEKYSKTYSEKEAVLEEHLTNLEKIIYECKCPLEGNAFYHHQSPGRWNEGDKLVRHDKFINKQINLFWCGTLSNKKVCEVGFNAGHSALLLLLAREYSVNLEFLIFDICRHAYTTPCLEYIKKKFDDVNFEMIGGNSITKIPEWIKDNLEQCGTFDVVHIDGGHSEDCIKNDFENADKLVKIGGIIIIDDTDSEHISKYVDKYLTTGEYVELPIMYTGGSKSYTFSHRMIKKNN